MLRSGLAIGALALVACGNSVTVIETSGAGGSGATGTTTTGTTSTSHTSGTTSTTTGGMVCKPGQTVSCACPDMAMGAQVCNAAGTGFDACVCDVGDPQKCLQCLGGTFMTPPCTGYVDQCEQVPSCKPWLDCTAACFKNDWTHACWRKCDKASMSAADLTKPIYGCLCAKCSAACAAACG